MSVNLSLNERALYTITQLVRCGHACSCKNIYQLVTLSLDILRTCAKRCVQLDYNQLRQPPGHLFEIWIHAKAKFEEFFAVSQADDGKGWRCPGTFIEHGVTALQQLGAYGGEHVSLRKCVARQFPARMAIFAIKRFAYLRACLNHSGALAM